MHRQEWDRETINEKRAKTQSARRSLKISALAEAIKSRGLEGEDAGAAEVVASTRTRPLNADKVRTATRFPGLGSRLHLHRTSRGLATHRSAPSAAASRCRSLCISIANAPVIAAGLRRGNPAHSLPRTERRPAAPHNQRNQAHKSSSTQAWLGQIYTPPFHWTLLLAYFQKSRLT